MTWFYFSFVKDHCLICDVSKHERNLKESTVYHRGMPKPSALVVLTGATNSLMLIVMNFISYLFFISWNFTICHKFPNHSKLTGYDFSDCTYFYLGLWKLGAASPWCTSQFAEILFDRQTNKESKTTSHLKLMGCNFDFCSCSSLSRLQNLRNCISMMYLTLQRNIVW